eukprot:7265518-Pyramimonas_sp.AAC.1
MTRRRNGRSVDGIYDIIWNNIGQCCSADELRRQVASSGAARTRPEVEFGHSEWENVGFIARVGDKDTTATP